VSTESAAHTVTGTARDRAGNSAAAAVSTIKIDKTAPITVGSRTAPNAAGWNNSNVTITLTATDTLSGIARTEYKIDSGAWTTYAAPVVVSTEGDHTFQYRSVDRADNVETAQSLSMRIDKTWPELEFQFSPATRTLVMTSRDDRSGVTPAPGVVSPTSVNNINSDTQRRTFQIDDVAGNSLLLVQEVKTFSDKIESKITSLNYNGVTTTPQTNAATFQWTMNSGVIEKLDQYIEVLEAGGGTIKQQVTTKYDASKANETEIQDDGPNPSKVTRPGMVLPRMRSEKPDPRRMVVAWTP